VELLLPAERRHLRLRWPALVVQPASSSPSRRYGRPGDDLILLRAFELTIAADRDFDDSFPGVIKTMRDLLAAVDDQASMN
jgi:hypothetical protein